MPGHERTGILHPGLPLHDRFHQVARGSGKGDHEGDPQALPGCQREPGPRQSREARPQ